MTWTAQGVRILSLVGLIPLILAYLPEQDAAVWFLLTLIFNLSAVFDFGFSATFTRLISYKVDSHKVEPAQSSTPLPPKVDQRPMGSTVAANRIAYRYLAAISATVLVLVGLIFLRAPILAMAAPAHGWAAWSMFTMAQVTFLYGNSFVNYLQGTNHVALLKRWETVAGLGQVVSLIATIYFGGGLVALAAVYSLWAILNVVRNYLLCRQLQYAGLEKPAAKSDVAEVLREAWPQLWRSGVGIAAALGTTQFSGLIYAQMKVGGELTAYLLMLRLITVVSQFSQAPFLSKLPILGQYTVQSRASDFSATAERGLMLSHWSFLVGFLGLAVLGTYLLPWLGKSADLFVPSLWGVLGMAFFLERQAIGHLLLYTFTNRVIWHVIHSLYGMVYLAVSLLLLGRVGAMAFPIGMIVGYLLISCPISSYVSYRSLSLRFPIFELKTSFFPFLIITGYAIFSLAE